MLNEEELRDAALLVFANKQDQPGAKGAGDISEALRLGELRDRNWSIVACSAVDGRGINEGMDWLVVGYSMVHISNPLTASSKRCSRKHLEFSVHYDTHCFQCLCYTFGTSSREVQRSKYLTSLRYALACACHITGSRAQFELSFMTHKIDVERV